MSTRNSELDRLRAFAIIMTLFIHYARVFFPWGDNLEYQYGTTILNIWANCWTGVDLFFVISGFIITKNIINNIDQLKSSTLGLAQYIKNFYIRRIYRIYPVAWLVFFVVLICSCLFNNSKSFAHPENLIEAGISIFTYTFNYYLAYGHYKYFDISSYWSLAVEEQFYLFLPLFFIFTRTNKQRVWILLLLLFLITFILRPFITEDNFLLTQNRCDGLIYGCLIYFLSQQNWFPEIIGSCEGSKYIRIFGVLILVLVLGAVPALDFSNKLVIPLACLISSILVILAALEKNIIISFSLFQRCLDFIGVRSYSLYIVHLPMFALTKEIMFRFSQFYSFKIDSDLAVYYVFTSFILTFIAAEMLHQWIEKPFIKRGRALINGKDTIEYSGLESSK